MLSISGLPPTGQKWQITYHYGRSYKDRLDTNINASKILTFSPRVVKKGGGLRGIGNRCRLRQRTTSPPVTRNTTAHIIPHYIQNDCPRKHRCTSEGGYYSRGPPSKAVCQSNMTASSGEAALFIPSYECDSPVVPRDPDRLTSALSRDAVLLKPPYWGTPTVLYSSEYVNPFTAGNPFWGVNNLKSV